MFYGFLSKGDGTFAVVPFGLGTSFGNPPTANYTPVVGDFDGDGNTDFAFAGATSANIFLSKGDGTFTMSSVANRWNKLRRAAGRKLGAGHR